MQESPQIDETNNSPNQALISSQNNNLARNTSKKYLPVVIGLCFLLSIIIVGWVSYLIGVNKAESNLTDLADVSDTKSLKPENNSISQASPILQPDSVIPLTATYQDPINMFAISYPDINLVQCDYDNDNGAVQFWEKPFSCVGGHDIMPLISIKKTTGMTLELERIPDEISELTINDMTVKRRVYTFQLEDGPLYGAGSMTELLFPIADTDQYISISVLGNKSDDIGLLMSMAESFKFIK